MYMYMESWYPKGSIFSNARCSSTGNGTVCSIPGVVPGCDMSLDIVNDKVAEGLGMILFSPWKHHLFLHLSVITAPLRLSVCLSLSLSPSLPPSFSLSPPILRVVKVYFCFHFENGGCEGEFPSSCILHHSTWNRHMDTNHNYSNMYNYTAVQYNFY